MAWKYNPRTLSFELVVNQLRDGQGRTFDPDQSPLAARDERIRTRLMNALKVAIPNADALRRLREGEVQWSELKSRIESIRPRMGDVQQSSMRPRPMPPPPPPYDDEEQDYDFGDEIDTDRIRELMGRFRHNRDDRDEDTDIPEPDYGEDLDQPEYTPQPRPYNPNELADALEDAANDFGRDRDRRDRDQRRRDDDDDKDRDRDRDGGLTADDLVPGSKVLSEVPAPPGYSYAINPITGDVEIVDLTPLDKTKPLEGWKWIADPSDPEKGHWTFIPTPDVLDKPFEGIPTPVIGWLQTALNAGGDLSVVPEGPAREWVNFLMTQATAPGRRPDSVPFGLGLPNFERYGYEGPTPPSGYQEELDKLLDLVGSGAPREQIRDQMRILAEIIRLSNEDIMLDDETRRTLRELGLEDLLKDRDRDRDKDRRRRRDDDD